MKEITTKTAFELYEHIEEILYAPDEITKEISLKKLDVLVEVIGKELDDEAFRGLARIMSSLIRGPKELGSKKRWRQAVEEEWQILRGRLHPVREEIEGLEKQ